MELLAVEAELQLISSFKGESKTSMPFLSVLEYFSSSSSRVGSEEVLLVLIAVFLRLLLALVVMDGLGAVKHPLSHLSLLGFTPLWSGN